MSKDLILNQMSKPTQTTTIELNRAIAEVQAMCIIARNFPRDRNAVIRRIQDECAEKTLAKQSSYSFPRGGSEVTGPSIRLAETVANCYGNITYGVRVLGQEGDVVQVQAFCWDVETNVRKNNDFELKLEKKSGGAIKKITDPRDVYEHSSSQAQRRVRECILAVVSKSIIETAISECEKTLNAEPIQARIEKLIKVFSEYKITEEMIKEKMGKNIDALNNADVTRLGRMYQSIKDGMAGVDAFFPPKQAQGMNVADLKGSNAPTDATEKTDTSGLKTHIQDQEVQVEEVISQGITNNDDVVEQAFKRVSDGLRTMANQKSVKVFFEKSSAEDLKYLEENAPRYKAQLVELKNKRLEELSNNGN